MDSRNPKTIRAEPGEELDRIARATVDTVMEFHRHLGLGYL